MALILLGAADARVKMGDGGGNRYWMTPGQARGNAVALRKEAGKKAKSNSPVKLSLLASREGQTWAQMVDYVGAKDSATTFAAALDAEAANAAAQAPQAPAEAE